MAIDKRQTAQRSIINLPKIPNVTWNDVGGFESIKKLIIESLQMNLYDLSECEQNNLNWRRSGILMYGPPGCGKTMIAKGFKFINLILLFCLAVANEFKMTFLSVKGPELLNQYVGQSEKNLRDSILY